MDVSYSEEIHETPRGIMSFYIFGYNGAKIDILEMNDSLELSSFINKGEKGDGRKLLCHVVRWIKENKSKYDELTLASVPSFNKYKGLGMSKNNARVSLNGYYKSLGFKKNRSELSERDFTGRIDELMDKCLSRGGRRSTRKRYKYTQRRYKYTQRRYKYTRKR